MVRGKWKGKTYGLGHRSCPSMLELSLSRPKGLHSVDVVGQGSLRLGRCLHYRHARALSRPGLLLGIVPCRKTIYVLDVTQGAKVLRLRNLSCVKRGEHGFCPSHAGAATSAVCGPYVIICRRLYFAHIPSRRAIISIARRLMVDGRWSMVDGE